MTLYFYTRVRFKTKLRGRCPLWLIPHTQSLPHYQCHSTRWHIFLPRMNLRWCIIIIKIAGLYYSSFLVLYTLYEFGLMFHHYDITNPVQFRCSVLCNSLWPRGLQHARLPCPSSIPRACSNSCPSSWWYHATISSSASPSPPAFNLSQHQGFFQWVSFCIRWPKYWSFSFSISRSNEYSGLISFRIDWFDILAVQGTLKSFL